ncbi:MAG: hypothetical protein PSN46_01045 [Gammaproteobacteria bacterium]|nr:hypothetical protein [Gammaproteobacteria bacterium]
MAFGEAKSKVIECLNNGCVFHEERDDIDVKNLLSTGAVSISTVTTIIGRARGNNYFSSPHHYDSEVDVHVIKTTHSGQHWYIKWYFTEPDCVFISVHK